MVVVHAPSRLHFGLLNPCPAPSASPDLEGDAAIAPRSFGGVGLMIQAPGLRVRVEPAASWSADGPLARRALQFAETFLRSFPKDLSEHSPQRIVIEQSAPEHLGLGAGTQLGLAVALALTHALRLGELAVPELAKRVGRGERSALGVHGFAQGGFVVEGGKRHPENLAPLIVRMNFPATWRVVVLLPSWGTGLHGPREKEAFHALPGNNPAQTDALCRLVLLGMLPALLEQDLTTFGEALYDFNRRAGEVFRPIQGGIYAHPQTASVVAFVRGLGIRGVGQSSWGPAVFAVTDDQERADDLSCRLLEQFNLKTSDVIVSSAANAGFAVCPGKEMDL